jgi:RHS repeat-associated protein
MRFRASIPEGFGGDSYYFAGLLTDPIGNDNQAIAREYSGTQGRWESPDPAGMAAVDPSNPQTWNRYAYVGNNPLSYADPSGLDPDPCNARCRAAQSSEYGSDEWLRGHLSTMSAGPDGWYGQQNIWLEHVANGAYFSSPDGVWVFTQTIGGWGVVGSVSDSSVMGPANNHVPRIGPPQQYTPAKQPSQTSKYFAFLGCEYNSVVETITDEEDNGRKTAYGFINAGALWSIRTWQTNWIGITFVATAGAMDVGAMAKANIECTDQIYH